MSWGEVPSTDSAGMKTNDLHILTVQYHFGFTIGRVSQFHTTCIHYVVYCILHEYKGKSIKTSSIYQRRNYNSQTSKCDFYSYCTLWTHYHGWASVIMLNYSTSKYSIITLKLPAREMKQARVKKKKILYYTKATLSNIHGLIYTMFLY